MSPNRLYFLKLNTPCHFHIMSGLKIQIAIVFLSIPGNSSLRAWNISVVYHVFLDRNPGF